MRQEIPYQNQDLESINPIQPDTPDKDSIRSTKFLGFKLPTDPKLKLLVALGAIVLVLSLLSLFVTIFRKGPIAPRRSEPTPTIFVTPIPTENIDVSSIPDELRQKFREVDADLNTIIDFAPPQIDPDIGIN